MKRWVELIVLVPWLLSGSGTLAKAEDPIDHAVGVDDLVKVGDPVRAGGALCAIHANSDRSLKEAEEILAKAIEVGDAPRPPARLVDEIIG